MLHTPSDSQEARHISAGLHFQSSHDLICVHVRRVHLLVVVHVCLHTYPFDVVFLCVL